MIRCGFVCLLVVATAWGQAANSTAASQVPTAQSGAMPRTSAPASTEAPQVSPDTPVITIKGLCDPSAPKSPSLECRTEITRAQFEQILDAVQPNMPPRARRQFASRYASILAMSTKAAEMGLDKGPDYEEQMKLARMQVLARELNKDMQEKAGQISDKDVEDYYKANPEKFEQAELLRIYVPKTQQVSAETDDKKPPSEAAQEKQSEQSEEAMKTEADKLRARAAAGEDFAKLEEDAFKFAGIKSSAPNTNMGKVRRNALPPTQASAMEMKPGEVSPVIADQSGFFIYKLVSKDTMPLDEARDEIKGTLRSERLQNEMKAMQESATPTLDEAYFGPEMPARPMIPGGPGGPPLPAKPAAPPGPK
jgi:hypothetical protein